MSLRITAAGAALSACLLVTAAGAFAYTGQRYASQAKVTIAQARAIALKAVPAGKITGEELEKEDGGLRFSFDVKIGSVTREVGVDAKTGKVLENSVEGANSD